MLKNVRVRIAPSPTGIPHIGNTRTALFNYLFARKNKGTFILRVEDTDQKRVVSGAREAISEILEWLELIPDEVYTQSERINVYTEKIQILLEKKIAYKKEGAIWIKVPDNKEFSWRDAIGNKNISFKGGDVEDFVAIKSDGFPTYHFASVVDDHKMEISHVIRGDEWISSTPKHLFLYESFDWKQPVFAHLPVILGPDRAKLSKRHGAESVLDFRKKGYLKETLLNFMALLGWSPGEDREIMDLQTMIDLFELRDVNTGSPVFDLKKLEWMNGLYIRERLGHEDFKKRLAEFYKNDPLVLEVSNSDAVINLARVRMNTLADFKILVEKKDSWGDEKISPELKNCLIGIPDNEWEKEKIFECFKSIMSKYNIRMPVIYKIFTGREQGLPLPDFLAALGKRRSIVRLE